MAGGMVAKNDLGFGRDFQPDRMGADGDTSVRTSSGGGLHAPHVRPPWALRDRAQDRPVLRLSLRPSLPGRHFKLAMDFVLVAMQPKRCDVSVRVEQMRDHHPSMSHSHR